LFIAEGSDIMSKKDNVKGYVDKKYINWEITTYGKLPRKAYK
jgi:hypothetical protein